MTTAVLKRHDFSVRGLPHWLPVEEPATIFALGAREGTLKQRFASIEGFHVLQALDEVNGFAWKEKQLEKE